MRCSVNSFSFRGKGNMGLGKKEGGINGTSE